MSSSLEDSRRRLRSYLLPGSATDAAGIEFEDKHFPRSKVMRFAFNPRNRPLVKLAGSVIAVLATRAVGAGRLGTVAAIAQSISSFRKSRS